MCVAGAPARRRRERLRDFYAVYCPSKLPAAEAVLRRFAGRERVLFALLEEQYKCVRAPVTRRAARLPPPPAHRAAPSVPQGLLGHHMPDGASHAAAADDSVSVGGDRDSVTGPPPLGARRAAPTAGLLAPPPWVKDSAVRGCQVCERSFSLWRTRHHCRRCGRCVCAECAPSALKRPIVEFGYYAPVRQCRDCVSL